MRQKGDKKDGTNRDFMVVGYGYMAIYGIEVAKPLEVIASEMSTYSLRTLLVVFMKVALTFLKSHETTDQAVQIELLKGFFPLETRKKIVEVVRRGDSPNWSFFVEQTLYNLLKMAFENAGDDSKKDVTDDDVEKVGRWFLLMADACLSSSGLDNGFELPVSTQTELIRQYTTRQFYLRHDERLANRLCRYKEIVKLTQTNKHNLNVTKLFEEASGGVDVKTYLDVVFFLMSKWAIKGTTRDFETGIVIEREEWFRNIKVDKTKVIKVLDLLSFTPEEYNSHYQKVVDGLFGGQDEHLNNFMVFMQRPLIQVMETRYICPFSTYLAEKSSTGIYWLIENFLRGEGREVERSKLPQVWGDAFEAYINTRIKSFAGESYYPNYTVGRGGEIDGVLALPNIVCLLEAKAPHVSYLAQLKATPELLEPHLNQLIGKNQKGKPKGLGQITRAITGFRKNEWSLPFDTTNKKFLPVVVTEEAIHIDAFSRKYYEDFAKRKQVALEDADVLPFIIIDAGEVEFLEAIAEEKGLAEVERLLVNYSLVFRQRNEHGFCRGAMSLRNYLYTVGYPLPENKFLKRAFDQYSKELRKYFNKGQGLTK